ncbi:PQQ-binding-like beta-propeller repeat protein, partial [Planctomycetota bacterium]
MVFGRGVGGVAWGVLRVGQADNGFEVGGVSRDPALVVTTAASRAACGRRRCCPRRGLAHVHARQPADRRERGDPPATAGAKVGVRLSVSARRGLVAGGERVRRAEEQAERELRRRLSRDRRGRCVLFRLVGGEPDLCGGGVDRADPVDAVHRRRPAPAYSDGRLYVGADDGVFRCFDASDGRVVWEVRARPRPDLMLGH